MTINVVVIRPGPEHIVIRGVVTGVQGTPGPVGSATTWPFSSPAATWTVVHNLGRKPLVQVVLADGSLIVADVEYADLNTVVVTHAAPTTGAVLTL